MRSSSGIYSSETARYSPESQCSGLIFPSLSDYRGDSTGITFYGGESKLGEKKNETICLVRSSSNASHVLLGLFGQTVCSIITISQIFPSSQELFLMYTTTWNGGKVYLVPSCSVQER